MFILSITCFITQTFSTSLRWFVETSLQWRHNGRDGVSDHRPHDCLLNRLFRRRSKITSKLCVTVLCVGNSPTQRAINVENGSIWWRHHFWTYFDSTIAACYMLYTFKPLWFATYFNLHIGEPTWRIGALGVKFHCRWHVWRFLLLNSSPAKYRPRLYNLIFIRKHHRQYG